MQQHAYKVKYLETAPDPTCHGTTEQQKIRQDQPMFGGRMTDKRLKEVGRMTKEAITHLHT